MKNRKKFFSGLDPILANLHKGNIKLAKRLLNGLLKEFKDDLLLLNVHAIILSREKKNKEAKVLIDNLLRKKVSLELKVLFLITKIEIFISTGQNKLASKFCDNALKLAPKNHTLLEYKGRILLRQKKCHSAIKFLRKAYEKTKKCVSCLGNMAICYYYMKDIKNSIYFFKEVLKYNPRERIALKYLFIIYTNKKEYSIALKYINRIIKLDKKDCLGHSYKADTLIKLNKPELANKFYMKSIQICLKCSSHKNRAHCDGIGHVYNNYIRFLLNHKKYTLAMKYLKKAIKIKPKDKKLQNIMRKLETKMK